jgi:hypothetical protein
MAASGESCRRRGHAAASPIDPVRTPTAHRSNRNNVDLFEVRSTFWPYREDGYHLVGTADQWQR